MDLNALIIGLLSAVSLDRKAEHGAAGTPGERPPAWLAGLNDHQLRDLGYARERDVSHRHLLRM